MSVLRSIHHGARFEQVDPRPIVETTIETGFVSVLDSDGNKVGSKPVTSVRRSFRPLDYNPNSGFHCTDFDIENLSKNGITPSKVNPVFIQPSLQELSDSREYLDNVNTDKILDSIDGLDKPTVINSDISSTSTDFNS